MKQSDESTSRAHVPRGGDASPDGETHEGLLQRVAFGVTEWSERWFPDAFVFTALAVLVVAAGALRMAAGRKTGGVPLGPGFGGLVNFRMKRAITVIMG